VHAIQNSSAWADTAIIITYDEHGGRWDHVSPPRNNGLWGDGTRVPAIVISPYAKQSYVDHTEHDTLSILKTIEEQFQLQPLSQYDANASDLVDDFQNTPQVSIGSAYAQPDADNPRQFALIVQGTQGNDQIQITSDGSNVRVQISGSGVSYDHSFAEPISRIEIYGQSGDDSITVDQNVTIPAFIFSGNGNNVITAGGGPSVVVGGAGNNILTGGSGPSILIGGSGHEQLIGGSGATLMIAGTTKFDANLEALQSLEAEWSRTDASYEEKVAHLNGGASGGQNGSYVLDNSTVQSHESPDVINHSTGGGQDLFFADLFGNNTDTINGIVPGEIVIDI
jgi:hypothetical protein